MVYLILCWSPSPSKEPVAVALFSGGEVLLDPSFSRLKVLHPDVEADALAELLSFLTVVKRDGVLPTAATMDTFGLSRNLRDFTTRVLETTEELLRPPVLLAPPETFPSRRAAVTLLVEAHNALTPKEGEPDPLGRRDETNVVILAEKTADQALRATQALEGFAAVCRTAFPRDPGGLLTEDGLPRKVPDLAYLIAERSVVVPVDTGLRDASALLLKELDEDSPDPLPEKVQAAAEMLKREIVALPAPGTVTRRAVSPGAEALLGCVFTVLGNGLVEFVDYMGTDSQLVKIARVSTGSEKQELGLLSYLIRNRHSSPIEFGRFVIRVRMPIFLDRQWRRHRTGSQTEQEGLPEGVSSPVPTDRYAAYSERSLRYQPPLSGSYVPPPEMVQGPSRNNVKQGRGESLPPEQAEFVRRLITSASADAEETYRVLDGSSKEDETWVKEEYEVPDGYVGTAKELARSVLTLGTMTEWYWTTDAWNLMGWLKLRLDAHAQAEIRAYAEVVYALFKAWLPATAEAFRKYVLSSRTFSDRELTLLAKLVRGPEDHPFGKEAGESVRARYLEESGLSAGERTEFLLKLEELRSRL